MVRAFHGGSLVILRSSRKRFDVTKRTGGSQLVGPHPPKLGQPKRVWIETKGGVAGVSGCLSETGIKHTDIAWVVI